MKLFETRRKIVFGIALSVLVVTAIFALIQANRPYAGLTLVHPVELTDIERSYVQQRIEVTEAAIDAQQEASEEDLDLDLYLGLAWDYSLIGDLVNARETYEEFFTYNPIHYTALANYAGVLKKMNDIELAEEAYKEVVELRPSESSYRNYVALLQRYYDEGERDDDIFNALEEGVLEVGQTPWFMVTLADWYLDHGDCEKAFDHFEVAIGLNPGNTATVDDYEAAKVSCEEGQE